LKSLHGEPVGRDLTLSHQLELDAHLSITLQNHLLRQRQPNRRCAPRNREITRLVTPLNTTRVNNEPGSDRQDNLAHTNPVLAPYSLRIASAMTIHNRMTNL